MANGNKPLPGVSQRSKPFETLILSRPNNTQFSLGTVSSIGEQKNAIVVNVKRVEFKLVLILEIGLF